MRARILLFLLILMFLSGCNQRSWFSTIHPPNSDCILQPGVPTPFSVDVEGSQNQYFQWEADRGSFQDYNGGRISSNRIKYIPPVEPGEVKISVAVYSLPIGGNEVSSTKICQVAAPNSTVVAPAKIVITVSPQVTDTQNPWETVDTSATVSSGPTETLASPSITPSPTDIVIYIPNNTPTPKGNGDTKTNIVPTITPTVVPTITPKDTPLPYNVGPAVQEPSKTPTPTCTPKKEDKTPNPKKPTDDC